MRNCRGFVTILFLALLPLLLTLVFAWMTAETAIVQYARVQHLCRLHALRMQELTLTATNKLIELNPRATELRREYELAQNAVKAGGPPPVRAAAAAWLLKVHLQQLQLAAQQNIIWIAGNAAANAEQARARSEFLKDDAAILDPRSFGLHLQRTPALNLTPDYGPEDGFETRQTFRAEWKTNLARAVPPLLLSWLKSTKQNQDDEGMGWVRGTCSSTYVQKQEGLLTAYKGRLGSRGKSWWSSF